MVVDEQPANLKLMGDMLTQSGYGVRCFPRGRLALNAAQQQPPDLILLDINMPEMDGFEVCTRLKADKKPGSIPVIFLSAMNEIEDKVKAFRAGGIDYITKPFQFEEVQVRVETHLGLQRARRAERDLLENTLNGAVRTLADLIHQTGPALAARSDAIRNIVVYLVSRLGPDDPWQYELAATLCLIGCVALPAEVFDRAYGHTPNTSDEEIFPRASPKRLTIAGENSPAEDRIGDDRPSANGDRRFAAGRRCGFGCLRSGQRRGTRPMDVQRRFLRSRFGKIEVHSTWLSAGSARCAEGLLAFPSRIRDKKAACKQPPGLDDHR